jgi:molecular chaperone GrpE
MKMSSTNEPQQAKEDIAEDIQAVEDEVPEQEVKYLRLMADFQNYKRRAEKEKSDLYAYANEKILIELLEVIDDFERALAHEADASEGYAEGMNMIFRNFKSVLERVGLSEIKALGEDFDPNVHNAVMTEGGSGYESGRISDVIKKGYKLNNKVIRPSMVKVAE